MASSDQRAYVYLQLPQSLEMVTAGFYELDIPQGRTVQAPSPSAATSCRRLPCASSTRSFSWMPYSRQPSSSWTTRLRASQDVLLVNVSIAC